MKDGANVLRATQSEKGKGSIKRSNQKGTRVTEERAKAQRAKLDSQAETRSVQQEKEIASRTTSQKKTTKQDVQAKRRSLEMLIESYIQDHIGGNHSEKTIEWHQTALRLMRLFFADTLNITFIDEVEVDDISAWFAHMRTTPGANDKVRSERTIQTYARSARAFFHWLIHRGTLELNPFDRVVFPKVGRPLIQTITTEEFEKLLLACTPPNETGLFAERATVRNQPFFGCSTIRVSASLNSRDYVFKLLTEDTESSQ